MLPDIELRGSSGWSKPSLARCASQLAAARIVLGVRFPGEIFFFQAIGNRCAVQRRWSVIAIKAKRGARHDREIIREGRMRDRIVARKPGSLSPRKRRDVGVRERLIRSLILQDYDHDLIEVLAQLRSGSVLGLHR